MDEQKQNTLSRQIRQGDLLFIRQEAAPDGVRLTPRDTTVILNGETTGHAHRLVAGAVLDSADGKTWLEIPADVAGGVTQVVHEEHNAVTLTPGVWLVVRQREYSPEEIRLVED